MALTWMVKEVLEEAPPDGVLFLVRSFAVCLGGVR